MLFMKLTHTKGDLVISSCERKNMSVSKGMLGLVIDSPSAALRKSQLESMVETLDVFWGNGIYETFVIKSWVEIIQRLDEMHARPHD